MESEEPAILRALSAHFEVFIRKPSSSPHQRARSSSQSHVKARARAFSPFFCRPWFRDYTRSGDLMQNGGSRTLKRGTEASSLRCTRMHVAGLKLKDTRGYIHACITCGLHFKLLLFYSRRISFPPPPRVSPFASPAQSPFFCP